MILSYLTTPNFLIISTLLLGITNLFAAFISKEDSKIRTLLLLIISFSFFLNILIIDFLFLRGMRTNFSLFNFGQYSFDLHLEPLGLIFLNLLGILWICSLIYTIQYLVINEIKNSSKFLFFMNLSVLSGVMISLSANLFTIFVCYEILTLSTAPLISHVEDKKVLKGLYKYLQILMISSILLFLPAILFIYAKIGHGNFVHGGFIQNAFSKNQTIILLLMFIFGISKSAIYPLHRWLPAAMVATYPVSALLHAVVVVKAGLFCIYKILLYVFGLEYLQSIFADFNWIILFPIFTIFYSSFKALRSDNIKMILAYSTINQLNIALLSAFMFTTKAIGAAILHLVSHSFTKICLFYAFGIFYSLKNTTKIEDLFDIKKDLPKTSFVILISGFSLIGIPPFAGFISKFSIMLAAAEQDNLLIMVVLAISSILSALYMAKILLFIYKTQSTQTLGKMDARSLCLKQNETKTQKLWMATSLAICISLVVLFFLIQRFINQFLQHL